eukprot:CAMPEP_0181472930 /NCGR_PEP_ID=MMETSP1110-20121109/39859_1 /TAXON_ID=174948 /ORGANISM="Symbiodinium sp., Strain CCMP421" /LENGTH=81 /DNA_ID=CAMNT_0023598025 /DNA_START=64 /DNA_END=309 /DNA_ORIENTATION=-
MGCTVLALLMSSDRLRNLNTGTVAIIIAATPIRQPFSREALPPTCSRKALKDARMTEDRSQRSSVRSIASGTFGSSSLASL